MASTDKMSSLTNNNMQFLLQNLQNTMQQQQHQQQQQQATQQPEQPNSAMISQPTETSDPQLHQPFDKKTLIAFNTFRKSNQLIDLIIKINTTHFKCHKLVLQNNSKLVAQLLSEQPSTSNPQILDLTTYNVKINAFETLLDYFYTLDLNLNVLNCSEILITASSLKLDSNLLNLISKFYMKNQVVINTLSQKMSSPSPINQVNPSQSSNQPPAASLPNGSLGNILTSFLALSNKATVGNVNNEISDSGIEKSPLNLGQIKQTSPHQSNSNSISHEVSSSSASINMKGDTQNTLPRSPNNSNHQPALEGNSNSSLLNLLSKMRSQTVEPAKLDQPNSSFTSILSLLEKNKQQNTPQIPTLARSNSNSEINLPIKNLLSSNNLLTSTLYTSPLAGTTPKPPASNPLPVDLNKKLVEQEQKSQKVSQAQALLKQQQNEFFNNLVKEGKLPAGNDKKKHKIPKNKDKMSLQAFTTGIESPASGTSTTQQDANLQMIQSLLGGNMKLEDFPILATLMPNLAAQTTPPAGNILSNNFASQNKKSTPEPEPVNENEMPDQELELPETPDNEEANHLEPVKIVEDAASYTQVRKRNIHNDVPKPHACSICGSRFTRFHNLKQHIKLHSGIKPYQCDHCGKRFTRNYTLRLHKQKVCTQEKFIDSLTGVVKPKKKYKKKDKSLGNAVEMTLQNNAHAGGSSSGENQLNGNQMQSQNTLQAQSPITVSQSPSILPSNLLNLQNQILNLSNTSTNASLNQTNTSLTQILQNNSISNSNNTPKSSINLQTILNNSRNNSSNSPTISSLNLASLAAQAQNQAESQQNPHHGNSSSIENDQDMEEISKEDNLEIDVEAGGMNDNDEMIDDEDIARDVGIAILRES